MGVSQGEKGPATSVGQVVRRISQEGEELAEAALPLEEPLAIEVDGRLVAVLMRTPGAEKALALGYCLSEGLIESLQDVLLIHHCGSGLEEMLLPASAEEGPFGGRNRVRLSLSPAAQARRPAEQPARWVFSGCAGVDAAALGAELHVGREELRLPAELLWATVPAMGREQTGYRATGGIHAAALFDQAGQRLAFGEDVGRHNAVDKVIGQAVLEGRGSAALLVSTGRASSDIVAKAARVGVPVVASFSSSTSLGVRLAEAAGVTLVGYLRRNRFVIYTHGERVVRDT